MSLLEEQEKQETIMIDGKVYKVYRMSKKTFEPNPGRHSKYAKNVRCNTCCAYYPKDTLIDPLRCNVCKNKVSYNPRSRKFKKVYKNIEGY